jgi:NADPH-dependent glutamate synthase beta subunit-like oxidoreductase
MRSTLTFPLVFALLLNAHSALGQADKKKPDPVCIVGAGPSGLTVANGLQAKGYKTVIFDKNSEVGGKCQAYYNPQ